ncbi:MAG: PEP-CTERM sorting domain-containing protein [Phycisphaeraceae bacterium]|nr:PEP-CTERM sorting domain-containing protein [Phycisphaeraceae bacterium]
MRARLSYRRALCLAAFGMMIGTGDALANPLQVTYRFDPIEGWPASPGGFPPGGSGLLPDDFHTTIDGVTFHNYTNNSMFFDSQYLMVAPAAASGGVLNGNALWADPLKGKIDPFGPGLSDGPSPELYIEFDTDYPTRYVAFDFAWTHWDVSDASGPVSSKLPITVTNFDGDDVKIDAPLNQSFLGAFPGTMGRVVLNTQTIPGISDIHTLIIDLKEIASDTVPSNKQFAIDNFSFIMVEADDDGDNGDFDLDLTTSVTVIADAFGGPSPAFMSSSWISPSQSLNWSFTSFSLVNEGDVPADFLVTIEGPHSANPGGLLSGTIGPNETLESAFSAQLQLQGLASGIHQSVITITNLQNPDDDPWVITRTDRIYDPAIVTADQSTLGASASEIAENPLADVLLTLSNAPVAGHAGALRAGAQITNLIVSGGPVQIIGFEEDMLIEPGQSQDAQLVAQVAGLLAGPRTFTITAELENAIAGPLLTVADDLFLDPAVWTIVIDVPVVSSVFGSASSGSPLSGFSIAGTSTAAAIVGGTASTDLDISLGFTGNPDTGPKSAIVIGDVVNLTFSEPGDLYVLQLAYSLDNVLAAGLEELELRVLVFDTASEAWVEATLLNSDGGAGASFFEGSYAAYLSGTDGDPALSAFGVDTINHQIWAVLDTNSSFAVGIIPEPASLALMGIGGLLLMSRRRAAA